MDSPSSTTRIAARSSMIDSIRGCGLSGMRIDKEDLRRKLSIPEYLRVAMSNAIRRKEGEPPADTCQSDVIVDGNGVQPPEAPMVVFINSRSGGRHGPELKERLQELMGKEQVTNFFFLISPKKLFFLNLFFFFLLSLYFAFDDLGLYAYSFFC